MESQIDYRLIFSLMNGKVSSLLNKCLNESFKKGGIDLTSEQWSILLELSMRDTCTQSELCRATSFSKPTVSRLLDSLEARGIILRDKSRVDWRSNYIRITREGQRLYDIARVVAIQTLKEGMEGLNHMEIAITQKGLNKVLGNLLLMAHTYEVDLEAELLRKRREKLIRRLVLKKK